MQTRFTAVFAASLLLGFHLPAASAQTVVTSDGTVSLTVNSNVHQLTWPRWPALETNQLRAGINVGSLATVPNILYGKDQFSYGLLRTSSVPIQFYAVEQSQLSSNTLLAATLLNRLTYGQTPDDLEQLLANPAAPQAFIEQQLAFESFPPETNEIFSIQETNSIPPESTVKTNWLTMQVSGTVSSTRLYLYLTESGEAYVDSIALYSGTGTNINYATNYVRNGDFESALSGPWMVSNNHLGSQIDPTVKCDGLASLHVVATSPGASRTTAIWQDLAPGLQTGTPCTLVFRYLPRTNSSILTIRLSGSGVSATPPNDPGHIVPGWVYATQTGRATSTKLYIYLDGAGEAYIDDIKLVAGMQPEVGANVIRNGDFESSFPEPFWTVRNVASPSHVSSEIAHTGNGSLH